MLKRIVIGVVSFGIVCLLAFLAFAWRPAIAVVDPPATSSFPDELIAKGKILAGAGYCTVCHTRAGGQPFAGGLGLKTPFGMVYSTNITPDPETGIGRWSLEAFTRAMHEGVARDGSHLFPVFPFDHFTRVSDDDLKALYAFIMTVPPVRTVAPANTIPFPLNIRFLQAGWKLLFFRSGAYQGDPSKSAEWNRGAYLATGLSHCGGCHTPRNLLGAEESGEAYTGAVIDNWIAPPLTDANPSPVAWTESELFSYLRSGAAPLHGVTAGSMSPVVHAGLSAMPDSDIHAIAVYFADLDHAAQRTASINATVKDALARSGLGSTEQYDPDARLYAGACIGCHYNAGPAPLAARPELALNSALTLPEPTNFINVVLDGIGFAEGGTSLVMPGYGAALADADIARLAAYLRRTRTDKPAWTDVEQKIAAARAQRTPNRE
jgi:mono/diheme cytochrome c family protein